MNQRVTLAIQVVGLVAVFVGVAMFSPAAALIVIGAVAVALGELR